MRRREPDQRGDRRQHQRFDEQLGDDPVARRAERRPHRDLGVASRGARVDQRADVGAGDEEDEEDRHVGHGDLQDRSVARRLTAPRQHTRAQVLVRVRRRGRCTLAQRGQLRVRLRLCVPGRHEPEHADRRPIERSVARAFEIQRRPQPVVDRERIALGHHADHRRRRSSELNGLSDQAGITAKAALPDVVAEHHDRGGAWLFIGFDQVPPEEWWHAGHLEHRCGRFGDQHRLR